MNESQEKKISSPSVGRRRWRGYIVIVGGILVHLSLGTVYTFGNMTPYMTSYMRKKNVSAELTYADSLWISAVATMGQGASVFIGGILQRKLGTRLTTLLGGWISSAGVLLTYFTIKSSFGLTALTYGGLFGFGVGIAYASPMGCGMKWLPDKKGLVNGLVVAGFGGGAFVFDQVQTAYLNPSNLVANKAAGHDKYFDQDSILDRVPSMFLILGGCYAAMQLIGVILLKDPPEGLNEQINRNDEETRLISSIASVDVKNTDLAPRQVLKKKAFYMLWFLYLFNGQGIQFISSLYKTYGQTFIKDDRFLAIVGSLAAVCNGGGRILWGYLADKFCFKVASMMSCGLFCVCILTFSLTERAGSALYLVYVCVLFLSFSGNFSLLPTATAKCFGQKYYVINYGFVFTATIVTSPIGVVLTSSLQTSLGWYGLFFMVAAFSFTSFLISLFFNEKRGDGRDI
ncbi:oxalate:formate antiporter-like isoform X2 [Pecten maximus]|uniref:oxalate:formate antiporter-like isoform X2 n=1 Tax=Pecten maximus TaxID=6579 RepID=UPI001458AA09|nr:oxalate:formate antiporter-like isoform X2 [Pecten maximus]